jgi:hypothetical protein
LAGSPLRVEGAFVCEDNAKLVDFKGQTSYIGGHMYLRQKKPINLTGFVKYFPEIHGAIWLGALPTNILSLLSVVGLTQITIEGNIEVQNIMNKYLPMGKKGMMQCQVELIKAGYKDQAKL